MNQEFEAFPDSVPVFPLPEVVLFPRALLPLHIFEPRYRAMTAAALNGDGFIAVALLKPGFEPLYYTRRAPIHPIAGLGRIVASEKVAEGNYNILLRGEARARLLEEVPGQPFRVARIEVVSGQSEASESELKTLRRKLRAAVRGDVACDVEVRQGWLQLFQTSLELGDLADLVASGLPVEAELRQCLLAEPDPGARITLLCEQLKTLTAVARSRRGGGQGDDWTMN